MMFTVFYRVPDREYRLSDVKIDLEGLDTPRVLELSTAHLTSEAAQWCAGKCTMENNYGFLFSVSDSELEECHPHVSKILWAAKQLEFDYVWFDCDANVCVSLDVYEW